MKVNENYQLVKWQAIFNLVLENDDICIRNFPSNKAVGYQIGPARDKLTIGNNQEEAPEIRLFFG